MKKCPYSHLAVTAKPHWRTSHPDAGYVKHLDLIGEDILHAYIEASHPVVLDSLSNELVKTVLRESGISDKSPYLLWDMNNVSDISFVYKQGINDLIYRWGPTFSVVVFYNVAPMCRIVIETFAAIVPNTMTVIIKENYEEAVCCIMDIKSGKPAESMIPEEDEDATLKREFLAAVARISWLNMLSGKILQPAENNRYYPYFKALAHMQEDLRAREAMYEKELQQLKNDSELRLTQKIILLNAQVELHKKEIYQFEQEKSALKSRISSQEMELTRISTAIGEKTSGLHLLCDQLKNLDIDQPLKQRMLEQCQGMIETELTEKKLKTELTTGDSEFLSKLQKKHPNLNQRELRISLMVKLNYDTREIARSTGISTRGMESIRYRMHKKLGLDRHKSIKTYLSELATE
jgi:DNA-binding CsgD family transcriptional regulator